MEFFRSEVLEATGFTMYEYLCTTCWSYLQELYDLMDLKRVIWGEL